MQIHFPPEADPETVAEALIPERQRGPLHLLPLLAGAIVLIAAAAMGLHHYISLDMLKDKRELLIAAVHAHPYVGITLYIGLYALLVAVSFPGALLMSMTGGFLFGPILGAAAAVTGMTIGATAMFLAARSALGDFIKRRTRAGGIAAKLEAGMRSNAFFCLLAARLLPALPFWVCNLASAFVAIPLRTYIAATILGVIPSTFIYASVGSGLGHVFEHGGEADLIGTVMSPHVILPLFGLALLCLLPVGLHAWRLREERSAQAPD